MRIHFTVLDGVDQGATYEFGGYQAFVVGRTGDSGGENLLPTDPYFSRHHMLVEVCGDAVVVKDLGSRNGLYVNGTRTREAVLASGDTLKAGRTTLRVEIEKAPGPASASGTPAPTPPEPPPNEEFLTDEVTRFATTGARGPTAKTARRLEEFRRIGAPVRNEMGTVERAIDSISGTSVSLERFDPGAPLEPRNLKRFLRQMEVLGTLEHPHVIRLVALGSDDGHPWIATEFAAAGDLSAWVRATGVRTSEEVLALGRQTLDALAYAHERGVAHRDVKPTSIRLRSTGPVDVALADFGLSKSYRVAGGSGLTRRANADGEVAFLAPEQILDSRTVGPRADLYSLAACMFHALAGTWHLDAPMSGPSVWGAILEARPVPLRTLRPEVPARLAEAIDRALARVPDARWRDAATMRAVLGA